MAVGRSHTEQHAEEPYLRPEPLTAAQGSRDYLPSVSLVMPNRDNAAVLDTVLDALARNVRYPSVELIVVDDGSTDGSREVLRRWRDSGRLPEFQLLERDHTAGGVVDALNAGLRAASGELIVQLDADASIETMGWLEKMVTFFRLDPRIGVITGKVVTDAGELQACGIDVVGAAGYHDRGCVITEPPGRRTSRENVRRVREEQWPPSEQVAEVDGGMGVCMMYRRETAIELGGYDRGFAPVWLDDLDLTISVRRAGFKVFYLPEVRAVHHLGNRARPDDRRPDPGALRQSAVGVRRGVGAVLPSGLRARLIRTFGWDRGPRSHRQHLASHYRYWRQKWGWDMLNPDMEAIVQRWGETEICWKLNSEMREVGEAIIAQYQAISRANVG